MTRYLAEDWGGGVDLNDIQALDVNGLEAATAWTRLDTRQGKADFRLVAIRLDGAIYRFLFVTPAELTTSMSASLRRTTYSFRPGSISTGCRAATHPRELPGACRWGPSPWASFKC
jgi:predicted Zn-dependent protease